jgi:hypothetical protein
MTEDTRKLDAQEERNGLAERASVEIPDERRTFDEENDYAADERRVPISDLRKVRSEAAKYRKQLRQLESEIEEERKKAELAKMEETDKLRAIAEEAETKARSLKKRADGIAKQAAIINAASALGFYNPRDAASIVDLSQIEVDDDGNVDAEAINEMVCSLAESKPYLIKGQQNSQEATGFGPTNPPSVSWPKAKLRAQDRVEQLKQKSSELMRKGNMAAAVKLYNRAWEKERGIKKTTGG